MKVFVVNSVGNSFSYNYATDLCIYGNDASDNGCYIFAGFQVLFSVTWYDNACYTFAGFQVLLFVAGMLVDLSVYNNYASHCFLLQLCMQLEVSAAGDSFCSKYSG